jgi:3-oxoacyl-[acyl-carrier protein] reductase
MNIIITGASRGIGYHTALQLSVNRENTVFALSRNEEGLRKLVLASDNNIIPVAVDITDEVSIKQAVALISERCSTVEILINNAGLLIKRNIEMLTLQDWKDVYAVNVFGVFVLTRQLLPLLRRGELSGDVHSHVVNISSMGGVQGSMKFDGLAAYSSSKGALITLTECLSNELREEGVRMNCIALGSVETEMFATAFPGLRAGGEVGTVSEWLAEFSVRGWRFFNGKTIPFSASTP